MNENSFEVLSALVDGEAVRVGALAAALELPGAHSALVDFVRIREAVESEPARPTDAFHARIGGRLPELERSDASRSRRAALWAAVAALAVLIPLGVYMISPPVADSERPPAPEPTHVLSYEPGVDWEAQ